MVEAVRRWIWWRRWWSIWFSGGNGISGQGNDGGGGGKGFYIPPLEAVEKMKCGENKSWWTSRRWRLGAGSSLEMQTIMVLPEVAGGGGG